MAASVHSACARRCFAEYKECADMFLARSLRARFVRHAVTGGAVGSFFMSMKKGVSRGIFSNEAGLGTGSIAHACADTQKTGKAGIFRHF